MENEEKFPFCIGCYDEKDPSGFYVFNHVVNLPIWYGTIQEARKKKEYVDGLTRRQNSIFRLVEVK